MRICWGHTLLLATCAVLFAMSLLSGCGSKGELYLPKEQRDNQLKKGPAPAPSQNPPAPESR